MSEIKFVDVVVVFLFLCCVGVGYGNNSSSHWYNDCKQYITCSRFPPLGFPFWSGQQRPENCGYPHLGIRCDNGTEPTLVIGGLEYYILHINQHDRLIRITRKDYIKGICPKSFVNTSLNWNEFQYTPRTQNFTILYGCKALTNQFSEQFSCKIKGVPQDIGYVVRGIVNHIEYGCNVGVVVPSLMDQKITEIPHNISLKYIFRHGFELSYTLRNEDEVFCHICEGESSRGTCGYDNRRNKMVCICPYGSNDAICNNNLSSTQATGSKHSNQSKISLIIGLCVAGGVVGLVFCIIFVVANRQSSKAQSKTLSTEASSRQLQRGQLIPYEPSPNSLLEKGSSYMGLKLFNYNDLLKATDDFDESQELGNGAFATVYYGKLSDGQEVAVKRFYENRVKRGGEYMNEVKILARLRHDNLVILIGCTSRKSKEILLVYEYIPNGTIRDHLHGKLSHTSKISWLMRVKIAVETAEGLFFLHQNDVVHRDVKTANILLDNNFQVKVADFGIAKLFPNDVSHVSTTPKGTPGYVDPQYYQTYRLTEKSDVYSFGVVLMELISSKAAVDISRHRNDINLATMAIDRIQKGVIHELVDPSLRYDVDKIVNKSVDQVAHLAFRCLQEDIEMRPPMVEVLESLKEVRKQLTEFKASSSDATT